MAFYIDELPEDAVKIRGAFDYIDMDGNVYGIETRNYNPNYGRFFIKVQNTVWGYKYCGIKYENGSVITKRVHRLVAEAFIPNPNNYPIVMHINNRKSDNRVENLRWGTISDNTNQAYEDKLCINDSSWDDSQSIPVDQYDTVTNKLLRSYGSVKEAERYTGITACTILFQCRYKGTRFRKKTYFTFHGEGPKPHDIVVSYDMITDEELCRFPNTSYAEEYYGIVHVGDMIHRGKPKWSKFGIWFKRIII